MDKDTLDIQKQLVIKQITLAFRGVPYPKRLTPKDLPQSRPFEAQLIQADFGGKHWSELSPNFLKQHSEHWVYFTPEAFHFFLPAYLLLTVDFYNSDYAGAFVLGVLADYSTQEPAPEYLSKMMATLDNKQREAIKSLYDYLHQAYPEDEIPTLKW